MTKKKCTLAIGRVINVRKACQGMELHDIIAQMDTLAAEAFTELKKLAPKSLSLELSPKVYLNGHSVAEIRIMAVKNGCAFPAYRWLTTEKYRELEKDYRVVTT